MRGQKVLALVLFFCSLTIVVLFGAAVYYAQDKYSYNDFYKRLQTRASIAAQYYLDADRLTAESLKRVKDQHLERLPEESEFVFGTDDAAARDSIRAKWELPHSFFDEIKTNGRAQLRKGDKFFSGLYHPSGGRNFYVVVSAENYYASHHLASLKKTLLAGLALVTLLTVGLSYYFSRQIFAPIKAVTQKVKQISTDNMHLRLEDMSSHNEVTELIVTFNDLLNRMETAFETQKNFISNASHEFGTPLTAIIGEADVALIKDRSVDEYKECLQKILVQAERLDQITKSLLFLAQTGYKGKKIELQLLRVDELVWAAKKALDQLNPQNQIMVDISLLPEDPKKLKVKGSKELLQLALANILNNACKYSSNKPVVVSIASSAANCIVVVRDEGIGIPEQEMPFIYDPFFRASNTGKYEGYGIGLPLSRNIIRLHDGVLAVQSVVGQGTSVRITLPLAFPGTF